MYRAGLAALAAALVLLPGAVVGQLEDIPELGRLEAEIDSLASGTHRAHYHHRHRHPVHHHSHPKAFLFARGPATADIVAAPADGLLLGRHPTVARKLGHMEQEINDLAGRQQAAKIARGDLEENVQKAVSHMNDAVGIKRELARTEAQIRSEAVKLKRLEDDRLRLDRTHGHLVSSLHHIMEPKIQFAETQLKQRQARFHDLESKASQWTEKEKKFHEASLAMLEERKESTKRLEVAKEAVTKARREQELAKKQLGTVKHSVAFDIEGFRYAQTRARAATSEAKRGKKTEKDAEVSVKRLNGILNMEQKRVDESMAIGKDRVQGKIREFESVREKSKHKAVKLSEEYGQWQRRQRAWASRVAATKQITHEAAANYADRQQAVLNDATAKVAYDAESDSDWAWDEWPGKKDAGDDVHLDAI